MSQYAGLYDFGASILYSHHGDWIDLRYDRSSVWLRLWAAHVELNSGETDKLGRRMGADGERLFACFLIETRFLRVGTDGQPEYPGERAEVLYDGVIYRASKSDERPICVPEDHEGRIVRFRTTKQEVAT